jgi:predicted dehydrogenase
MTSLKVACVGTGFIAGRHLEALATFPDVEVVAVADSVRQRAEEVAGRYGARAYDDGMALLGEEDLDALWICVPPFAHGPLEQAAVDRGLPFFVEKPLARDLDTAAAIADRVRKRGLLTGVGYHWRYLDAVEQAAAVLRARTVQLVLGQWLDRTPAAPWWARRESSGGQVLEQTTHLFDLARLLVGEVATVSAVEATVPRAHLPHADVPTASTTTLHFASGAIGTISSTCVLDWRHRVGLQLVAEGAVVDLVERSLIDHELRVVTGSDERVVQSAQDPVAREDRDFVDALQGKVDAVRVPYEEALRTQELVWAADRSARERTPVDLPPQPPGAGRA